MVVNIFYLSFIDMCWKQNVVLQFCAWEVREDGFNAGCKAETNTRNIRKNLFNVPLPLVCLHAVCLRWGWGAMFPPDICRRLATGHPIAAVFSAATSGVPHLYTARCSLHTATRTLLSEQSVLKSNRRTQKWHHSNYVTLICIVSDVVAG